MFELLRSGSPAVSSYIFKKVYNRISLDMLKKFTQPLINKKYVPYLIIFSVSTYVVLSKLIIEQNLRSLELISIVALMGLIIYATVIHAREREQNIASIETIPKKVEPPVIGYLSDVGQMRSVDEDSILIIQSNPQIPNKISRQLLIVADGVGGHSKGEIASYFGVKKVAEVIFPWISREGVDKMFSKIIQGSITEANTSILEYTKDHPECEGMGTTMTLALIDESTIYIGHVGDTRAYLINKGNIERLTKDHSQVQELIDKGEITEEEALHHPQRNVITRVVGYHPKVECDLITRKINIGDRLLMCCDGLTNYVRDAELNEIVMSNEPQTACNLLVNLANQRGGSDNISVIVTPEIQAMRG